MQVAPYPRSMEFRVLGPVEVVDRGLPVPLGGRKQRIVLGLLLARAGRSMSVERLSDALWGEDSPVGRREPSRRMSPVFAA